MFTQPLVVLLGISLLYRGQRSGWPFSNPLWGRVCLLFNTRPNDFPSFPNNPFPLAGSSLSEFQNRRWLPTLGCRVGTVFKGCWNFHTKCNTILWISTISTGVRNLQIFFRENGDIKCLEDVVKEKSDPTKLDGSNLYWSKKYENVWSTSFCLIDSLSLICFKCFLIYKFALEKVSPNN